MVRALSKDASNFSSSSALRLPRCGQALGGSARFQISSQSR
jgi:hypothetical protein